MAVFLAVLTGILPLSTKAEGFLIHEDTSRPGHCYLTNTQGQRLFDGEYLDECFAIHTPDDTTQQSVPVVHLYRFRHHNNAVINTKGEVLYYTYWFDNGPDYIEDGLVRIKNAEGLIGFADGHTGHIIIEPQYACAFPFAKGVAEVAITGVVKRHGEHSVCVGDYFKINRNNERVELAP